MQTVQISDNSSQSRKSSAARRAIIMAYGKKTRKKIKAEARFARMGERMKAARLEKRMTQEAVANALDVTKQTISHYEKGQGTPTVANLVAYCMILGVSITDMLEDIDRDYSETFTGARVYKRDKPQQVVGRYNLQGLHRMYVQGEEGVKPEAYVTPKAAVSALAFELEVTNRSMSPLLEPGYLAVFDPEVEPAPGDVVVAVSGDEIVIRRYRRQGRAVILAAINEDWGEVNMGRKDKIIGTMIEFTVPREVAL